ncbi:MAG: AraC family transcriptional regulator ligand-binding domain-containing protein [Pseudomonadota bacterium]
MVDEPDRIPAYWIQGVARQLGERSEVVVSALKDAGLSHDVVKASTASVTYAQELTFLDAAARHSQHDFIGAELGVKMDPRRTSLLSYLLLNSLTLGDGIRNVERYLRLVRGTATTRLDEQEGSVSLVFDNEDPMVHRNRQHAEFVIGASLSAFRIATGTALRPLEVRFAHERRSHRDEVSRVLGSPVRFGCARLELVLSRASLELKLVEADVTLLGILLKHAERQLEESKRLRPALRHRVERSLLGQLHREMPSANDVASQLGLSLRTLTRRLAAEGCTYREVTEALRLKLAESYLSDPCISLAEIAFLLGYADQSSFTTAFKRWTGATPRERRLELLQ